METMQNQAQLGRPMSRPSDLHVQARAAAAARAAVDVILAIADCIRELGSVPSGHLFARVMGHIDVNAYQGIIDALVRADLVREHANHLLEWIGPVAGPSVEETQNPKEPQP